jgi:multidrug transporter EmrE-like cation transporter
MIALLPCISGALVAAVLASFDWCHGEVRATLALCLSGAGASGTLLACWSFYPAHIKRSVAYAVAAGLGAAGPLLLHV